MAEVSPILKDGDHEELNNNSPISLLPILSKICERICLSQLVLELKKKNNPATPHSGNRKHHSTETLLMRTAETILSGIDKKKVTAVVLLDTGKAFDSINHEVW